MLRAAAQRELTVIGHADTRSIVELLVSEDGKLLGRREVSNKLGVSERSLDRMLAREGLRFSEMVGSRRLEKAKRLLLSGNTVEKSAELLGYSEARSFRRAFHKATGMSPFDFRKIAIGAGPMNSKRSP